MSSEIEMILNGEKTIGFQSVDYSQEKNNLKLIQIKKEQKQILERKKVDWVKFNSFVFRQP